MTQLAERGIEVTERVEPPPTATTAYLETKASRSGILRLPDLPRRGAA